MTHKTFYIWRGLAWGALAGLVAAEIYLIGLTLVAVVTSGDLALFAVLLIGQIYGTITAILLGGISGALIGAVFAIFQRPRNIKAGATLGLVSAGVLLSCIVLGLLAASDFKTDIQLELHSAALLLPMMLLYLVAGAWVGGKLSKGVQTQPTAERPSNPNPLIN